MLWSDLVDIFITDIQFLPSLQVVKSQNHKGIHLSKSSTQSLLHLLLDVNTPVDKKRAHRKGVG